MRIRRPSPVYILPLTALLLALPAASPAQDAHYWTHQYGTRAELLGGMVVGSIKDLSSTFYNPGAVAYSLDQGLLLTTNAFELVNLRLQADIGEGSETSDTRLSVAPGMFAMRFPFDIGGNQIALSYLTRQSFELELSGNRVDSWWDPGWGTGTESYSSEFRYDTYLNEIWVGASWAKTVDEHLALGVTLFGAYRSQNRRAQTILQGAQVDGPGASATLIREYSYWNTRLLLKAGASFDYRPLAFGAAVTLPSLSLFGRGKVFYDDSFVNIDADGTGTPGSYLTSSFQDDLSSRFKSPLSVSAGTSYGYRTMTLHFSAEYFMDQDVYDIIEPDAFRSQTSGDTLSVEISGGMEKIFNLGFGIDYMFSERFSFYGGFTTDRSGYRQEVITTTTSWDLYHVNLGATFRAFEIDWTVGMGISWGSDEYDIELGFADDGGSRRVIEPGSIAADTDYERLKFIIGFAFPTKDDD
jgi:hypothetical protein